MGSSYVMADILAAFLWGQLECRQIAARSRRLRWTRYYEALKPWANSHGIDLPNPPPHCEHTHHVFYLVMPSRAARNQFISYLKKVGSLQLFTSSRCMILRWVRRSAAQLCRVQSPNPSRSASCGFRCTIIWTTRSRKEFSIASSTLRFNKARRSAPGKNGV